MKELIINILSFLFIVSASALLFFYWFMPFNDVEFITKPEFRNNYNFSLNGTTIQFYENLRYPSERISYRIDDVCNLQKKADAEWALEIIENSTILDFYPVITNEEIFITCENKIKTDERFFVAGEGGPTNITQTENFNVILKGGILLLRQSDCEKPNIALHELLHALGFDHSQNPNNIMYNISKCSQVLGDDIPETINEIYSIKPKADLSFENVSASIKGRYIDLNATIRNNGLKNSETATMVIYADDEFQKEVEIEPIQIGYGITLTFKNIFVSDLNVKEIKVVINSSMEELDKNNNEVVLETKK
ncbi:MAG: CARDB domain-containing protein [Nanoarchaeota archaeon]